MSRKKLTRNTTNRLARTNELVIKYMTIEELKEGDVIVLFNHVENRKRVIFCERLDCLAFQNSQQDGDRVFKDEFDENVRGNKCLSTFRMLKFYNGNIKMVDFQPIGQSKASK